MPFIELPPAQYDHAYAGTVVEHYMSSEEIEKMCGEHAWACTMLPIVLNGPCHIFLPWTGRGGVGGNSQRVLRRHETGHCNGWPGDHPQ